MAKQQLKGDFNLRDQSFKENISAESLNAHRIITDHMISCNVKPETIDISNKLLLSAKSSRVEYEEAKKQNREKEESETRNHNLEIINEEIADVKAKAENLSKVNEHLDKEFEDFVYEADRNPERASLLVLKATALKRKSNENKNDLKKLEETIKVLEEKRKKLMK